MCPTMDWYATDHAVVNYIYQSITNQISALCFDFWMSRCPILVFSKLPNLALLVFLCDFKWK